MRLQPTVSFWPAVPSATAFFLALSRSAASRLMRIIGRPPFGARGRRRRPPSALRPSGSATPSFAGSNAIVLNGSNISTGVSKRSCERRGEAVDARRAAAQHDAVDAIGGRGRLEEVERLLNLEQHVLGHRVQHRLHLFEGDAVDRLAPLELLGALERQVELLLHRFGVGVAADRDVAREHRLVAAEDVDVDRAGAGVQQHDDGVRARGRS